MNTKRLSDDEVVARIYALLGASIEAEAETEKTEQILKECKAAVDVASEAADAADRAANDVAERLRHALLVEDAEATTRDGMVYYVSGGTLFKRKLFS